MLTLLDSELSPNNCEVVELSSYNQYVYLIQKNGTSSLRKDIRNQKLRVYKNSEIAQLQIIDVYIRDPLSRYISGINTYLQHLQRDYKGLDPDTCFWFATKYNFLNRHYLPQFLWLVNLSRYISPECQINLRKFSDIGKVTNHTSRAGILPVTTEFEKKLTQSLSDDLKLWLFVDQMLEDMCGSSHTFEDIISTLQKHPSGSYNILIQKFNEVANNVLP